MKKTVKIYDLKDPAQYKDDRAYWANKTPEEKLDMLEVMRKSWFNVKGESDGNQQRFQKVLRIIEPE